MEPSITADGSNTLYSHRYAQTFHSRHGAVAESRHVFLAGSSVADRLAAGLATRVLEVGFGTGLNFLLTAQAALESGSTVSYVALERRLLAATILAGLGYESLAPRPLAALLEFRESLPAVPAPGSYTAELPGASLELRLGEAQGVLLEEEAFEAVYHDGFSPDANPELWTDAFLQRLAGAMSKEGRLVTYTVKGSVRRSLTSAGLIVEKRPGPEGGKREMLLARRPPPPLKPRGPAAATRESRRG